MLHVHSVVHRLRKAASNRLCDAKNAIQGIGAEERIVNEVVPHPVDVRIDHQRVDKPQNQHQPQRCMGIEKKQSNEISQMEQASQRGNDIPARMLEQPGICGRPLYSNSFGIHFEKIGGSKNFAMEQLLASF